MPKYALLTATLSLAITAIAASAFDKPAKARALEGAIACKDPQTIEEASELAGQGDVVAWRAYLWRAYMAGKCELLDEGDEFVVMGSDAIGNIISIRKWGAPDRMYVLSIFLDFDP